MTLPLIDETRTFISSQLREFTALDPSSGKFKTVPEYPEFSWLEGIVNAVTHRLSEHSHKRCTIAFNNASRRASIE